MKRYIKSSDINNYSYTGPGFVDEADTVFRWDSDDYATNFVALVYDSRTWYVDYMRNAFSSDKEKLDSWAYELKNIDQAIAKVNACLESAGADEHLTYADVDQWARGFDVSPKFSGISDMISWYSRG